MDRFRDAPWFDIASDTTITIIGAGGIGSWFSLFAHRANIRFDLFDDDDVDRTNISGQLFGKSGINTSKVGCMEKFLTEYSNDDDSSNFIQAKFNKSWYTHKITVSCVDEMESRKIIFNQWKQKHENDPEALFIDGRLEAEVFQIYSVRGLDFVAMDKYNDSLFDDDEVEDAPCSFKQTTHVAAMIGSFMCSVLINHLTNMATYPVRSVPFYIEMFTPLLKFDCNVIEPEEITEALQEPV